MTEILQQLLDLINDKYLSILAVIVVIFIFWKAYLKPFIRIDKRRKTVAVIVTIISTPICFLCLVLLLAVFPWYSHSLSFSKERWVRYKDNRKILADDLINNRLLIGKTKAEVLDLLGEYPKMSDNNWSFYLGTPVSITKDDSFLKIHYKNGRVTEVEKVEF